MKEKRRFISLFSVLLIMIAILAIMTGIMSYSNYFTSTRYIKREKDEIKAYYSSLYIDGTGDGTGIALDEKNLGYASFELRNYIDEDVTKRNIEYTIKTVDKFYDKDGNEMPNPDGSKDLYVLDLWDEPTKIGNDTCKYGISIEENSGEKTADGNYLFEYEERGKSAVGKKHQLTIKIERNSSLTKISGTENISIVVQIIKPYKTIYIIDMYVSNRLILFSSLDTEKFETNFKTLQIQTADHFAYTYTKTGESTAAEKQTAKAFKVTLTWSGLMLDESMLKNIHNNVLDLLGKIDENNLDISKPYIAKIEQKSDSTTNIDTGTLIIYVPQSSNFSLNFLPTSTAFNVDAKVEIYLDDPTNMGYQQYTQSEFGGYVFDENGLMSVIKSVN